MQSILAVLFLTVALICGFTSTSRLEAISQPSQGGGYPNYEPTIGATPDCLVTPKKYEHSPHTGAPPPPDTLRTYSILECCKTTYSGPNLQTQTTYCANYYEWKDQYYEFEHPPYGPPIDYISSWGLLPPYHVYLKSINNGGETISQTPVNTTGPGECVQGCGCIGCLAPGGNATNPGNNTGTLPPGSIFKVPPGTTNGSPTGNNTGSLPSLTLTKEHNPASPNLLSSAGNTTNPTNSTSPNSTATNPSNSTNSNSTATNPTNNTGTVQLAPLTGGNATNPTNSPYSTAMNPSSNSTSMNPRNNSTDSNSS